MSLRQTREFSSISSGLLNGHKSKQPTGQPTRQTMKAILRYSFHLVTLAALLLLGWVWLKYDRNVDAARTITRLTARMSMIIFLFVFSASSLHRLSSGEWSAALLKNRRRLGLTLAYSHTIHLICII